MLSSSKIESSDHTYSPPKPGYKRSPCPGLNAMANHGYIPRDGHDIGLFALVNAMREVYNLSIPLAALLAVAGLILCGHWKGFRRVLDLDALAAHNKIEHDASLVHVDAKDGDTIAPISVDDSLVRKLASYGASNSGLVLADFARARHDRETLLPRPLTGTHEEIACAERVVWDGNAAEGMDAPIEDDRASPNSGCRQAT
ncbi:heme-thiolate peroxidase [Pleurotus djamor]|nr:heme-thiolate peroxidase [Pleurotus djamor]